MNHDRRVDMDQPLPKVDRDICAINKDGNRPFWNSAKCQSGQRVAHLFPQHRLLNGLMIPWAWKSVCTATVHT